MVVVFRYRLLSVYSMCSIYFNLKSWHMEKKICFLVCTVISKYFAGCFIHKLVGCLFFFNVWQE